MLQHLKSYLQHPPSITVGIGFASLSLLLGSWLTRLPEMQQGLALGESQLGQAFLVMSIGGLIASVISNYFIERFKTNYAVFWSIILQAITFVFPLLATDFTSFIIAFLFLGLANGFINVTLNASAAGVERANNSSILSSCHGMFSVGAMIGAGSASLLAGWAISPLLHLSVLAALLILLNIFLWPIWEKMPHFSGASSIIALPPRPVLGLVLISFCVVLTEVVVMDWSSVYLKNTLESNPFITGLGFAGFSLSMAIGRFYGDTIIPQWGQKRIVVIGSLLGALGVALAALVPHPVVAIIGFTLSGIGFSCGVPILYSASAKRKDVTASLAIASIATAGILGAMTGRILVGYTAEYFSMMLALLLAAGIALLGSLMALKTSFQ